MYRIGCAIFGERDQQYVNVSRSAADYIRLQLQYSDSSHVQNMPSKTRHIKRYKARQYKITSQIKRA